MRSRFTKPCGLRDKEFNEINDLLNVLVEATIESIKILRLGRRDNLTAGLYILYRSIKS